MQYAPRLEKRLELSMQIRGCQRYCIAQGDGAALISGRSRRPEERNQV